MSVQLRQSSSVASCCTCCNHGALKHRTAWMETWGRLSKSSKIKSYLHDWSLDRPCWAMVGDMSYACDFGGCDAQGCWWKDDGQDIPCKMAMTGCQIQLYWVVVDAAAAEDTFTTSYQYHYHYMQYSGALWAASNKCSTESVIYIR